MAEPMRPAEQRPLDCADEGGDTARVEPIACKWKPGEANTPVPGLPTPTPPTQTTTPAPPPAGPTSPVPPAQPTPPEPQQAADPGFRYYPPGSLVPREASRGRAADRKVYVPDMVFPLKLAAAQHPHMNSQIYGFGGGGYNGQGAAGGSECDPRNYDPMVQRDNYCEVRGWNMPMCPAGVGHQGQDIRPPSCKDNTWEVVAVVDGTITLVTSNTTLVLKGKDGTSFDYLHMHPASITVEEGDTVKQGQVIGRVSKFMGGTRSTTYHLHFNARQRVKVGAKTLEVYVPVFSSLIASYRKSKGLDAGIDADGNLIADPRFEIGAVAQAPTPPAPTPPAPTPPAPTPPAPLPEFSKPPEQNAPPPAPAPKTWWQWGTDTATDLWKRIYK